jgi:hypothetical protein
LASMRSLWMDFLGADRRSSSEVSVAVGHATTRTTEEGYGRISVKRAISDLNRSWEAAQVPRCKKPLIDEKAEVSG